MVTEENLPTYTLFLIGRGIATAGLGKVRNVEQGNKEATPFGGEKIKELGICVGRTVR